MGQRMSKISPTELQAMRGLTMARWWPSRAMDRTSTDGDTSRNPGSPGSRKSGRLRLMRQAE